MTELEWYAASDCAHAHCRCSCDKPQPRMHDDRFVCGQCLVLHGVACDMIPCTPGTPGGRRAFWRSPSWGLP